MNTEEIIKKHPMLYKYLDCKGAITMLKKSNIRFTQATSLNDPFDCHHSLFDFSGDPSWAKKFKKMQKQTGVCCFSKSYNQLLMWSYYNKHEGVCIGLNIQDLVSEMCKFGYHDTLLVNYISKFKPRKGLRYTDDIEYLLSTKSFAWRHEKEVRIIHTKNDDCDKCNECKICNLKEECKKEYKFPFEPQVAQKCFNSLYLGLKIPAIEKQEIIDIARNKFPQMNIYDMEKKSGALQLKRIRYKYN